MVAPGRCLLRSMLALAALAGLATAAAAHPHVWITAETTVLYANGAFTGVRHKWTFDEYYAAMAIDGLDTNKDGVYDRNELAELAKVNMDGLKEFGYFTHPAMGEKEIKVGEPRDYWLEYKDGNLSLFFTLPFAEQIPGSTKEFAVSIYDPSFFIAFQFAKENAVKLGDGAPAACKASTDAPTHGKSAEDQQKLTQAFAMQFGGNGATNLSPTVTVRCGP